MDISKVLDSLKLSPKHLGALFLAGAFLLFARPSLLALIGLEDFRKNYLGYIGAVTLLTGTLLLTHGVSSLANWIGRRRSQNSQLKVWHATLQTLTPAEKVALRPYIFENENSALFSISDGVAGGLEAKDILYRASNIGPWGNFPYNLQPWAREHLTKHPELLQ